MIAKIAVFLAVVAVAYGGVAGVVSLAHSPASTVKLPHVVAAPVVTYAAAPVVHQAIAPAVTYAAAAPAVVHHAAPITYAAAPQVIAAPAAVAYATAPKIIHTHEPVEQHGYKIAY